MSIAQRYTHVSDEVRAVCEAAGRNPSDVTLIAVSKTVGLPQVEEAISAGACNFGENRPDPIAEKRAAFPQVNWHFIGNIQSRHLRDIVSATTCIHSLYQLHHAEKISEIASELGKVQDVLVEVNVSGEQSKSGLEPQEALSFVRSCATLPSVRVCGLMTMAPQGDVDVARACFQQLAQLQRDIRAQLPEANASVFNELSMGMSEDWREAIEMGATMVRIGRAIFSETFEM